MVGIRFTTVGIRFTTVGVRFTTVAVRFTTVVQNRVPHPPSYNRKLTTSNNNFRVSLVGMATRLRVVRPGFRIPVEAKDFSVIQNVQTGSGAHPAFYTMGTGVISQGKVAGA